MSGGKRSWKGRYGGTGSKGAGAMDAKAEELMAGAKTASSASSSASRSASPLPVGPKKVWGWKDREKPTAQDVGGGGMRTDGEDGGTGGCDGDEDAASLASSDAASIPPSTPQDPASVVYGGGGELGSDTPSLSRTMVYNPSRTGALILMRDVASDKFLCERGPIGNGKSVTMCWKIYFQARTQVRQWVVERDGTRHVVQWSKFLIARHTFKALDETTVETWNQWFGDRTRWTTNPYEGRFEELQADGTLLRIDFVCYATESRNIMNDLQSLELSGAWLNEASQMRYEVVARVYTRLKRFNPVPANRAPMKSFPVLMDTNSPDETNWWYRKEMAERPEGWVFFACPPAVVPEKGRDGVTRYVPNDPERAKARGIYPMENVRQFDGGYHDGVKYWMDQVSVLGDDEIRTLLMNEFGATVEGMPVYAEWNDQTHCVRGRYEVQRGMTVLIGMDLGRRPAAVMAQMDTQGVLRVFDEVTTWNPRQSGGKGGLDSEDVVTFFENRLRPKLMDYGFPNMKYIVFADPAGENCTEVSSISSIDHLSAAGLNIVSCDKVLTSASNSGDVRNANNVNVRLGCVSRALRTMRYGIPEIQVYENCEMLRKGFNGKYCFRKMRCLSGDGSERYDDKPDKGPYSHIHDAFQYLCIAAFMGAQDYSRPAMTLGGGTDYDFISPGFDPELV